MKILRGHFLVEQKLNELLDICLRNPEVWREQKAPRVNFHIKMYLVKSVAPEATQNPWLWPSIAKLNSIRNLMAHSLESERLTRATNDFVTYLKQNNTVYAKEVSEFEDVTTEQECEGGIASIYAFLTVYARKLKESRSNA